METDWMETDRLETMARVLERIAATGRDVKVAFTFRSAPAMGGGEQREMLVDIHRGQKEWHTLLVLPDDHKERAFRIAHLIHSIEFSLASLGFD
jgi:hypothetical protein